MKTCDGCGEPLADEQAFRLLKDPPFDARGNPRFTDEERWTGECCGEAVWPPDEGDEA